MESEAKANGTGNGPGEHIVGFIDLGTNSVRLLLVRINANHSYTVLSEQKETVRLGEGEFRRNTLQPEAMRRAGLVCARFAEIARSRGASDVLTVATSATREAENRTAFLRHLHRIAGVDVRVISGKEEARLIYLGVASGVNIGGRQSLFIDVGGGSTEVIVGDQQQYRFLDSLKLGAIRLSGMYFRPGDTGPVSPSRYARIQRYIRTRSVRTLERLRQFTIEMAIGSSGTVLNLAEIAMRQTQKRSFVKGDVLTRERLREVVDLLCSLPLEKRREVPGINPERADIIIAGAAILETLMEELELWEVGVSERGLREGLPIDYLSRAENAHLFEQTSFRERSVLELGRRCGFDERHARQVVRIAWELFDSAREAGLHSLGEWERELLEHACLLHDVGAFISYTNHRAHSYYVIRNADLLGFDQTEIALIATVTLFHHKAFPRLKHAEFAELDKRSRGIAASSASFCESRKASIAAISRPWTTPGCAFATRKAWSSKSRPPATAIWNSGKSATTKRPSKKSSAANSPSASSTPPLPKPPEQCGFTRMTTFRILGFHSARHTWFATSALPHSELRIPNSEFPTPSLRHSITPSLHHFPGPVPLAN